MRIYPLPYVTYRLDPKHMDYAGALTSKIREDPSVTEWQIPGFHQRVLGCLAFADVYDKVEQLKKLSLKDHLWGAANDFMYGTQERIKLMVGRANEKWESTGFSCVVTMPGRVLERNKGETCYVITVLHVPYVHFVGWLDLSKMAGCIEGKTVRAYPGILGLRSMKDLGVENDRRKGIFV